MNEKRGKEADDTNTKETVKIKELVAALKLQDDKLKQVQYKLDPNTAKFRGEPREDVELGIRKIEKSMRVAGVPEKMLVDVASPYIEGAAGIFLVAIEKEYEQKNKLLPWDDLKKIFKGQYIPADNLERKRAELRKLRQDQFDSYVTAFLKISNTIEPKDMTDNVIVNIDGLELGKMIRVGEVSVPNCVILDAKANSIVSVETSRALREAAAAEAKGK
jgi:hypothetical protein